MSNSLDPDQAQRFDRPDMGSNSLERLSADETRRQKVNSCDAEYFNVLHSSPIFYLVNLQHSTYYSQAKWKTVWILIQWLPASSLFSNQDNDKV